MKGLIYRDPADLMETGEGSKGSEPGINTISKNLRFTVIGLVYFYKPLVRIHKSLSTFILFFLIEQNRMPFTSGHIKVSKS